MKTAKSSRKFSLGEVVITRGASETLTDRYIWSALNRHRNGDWGEVCDEDWDLNEQAVKHNASVLSRYRTYHGACFWIITEWDRSVTTILLPQEY